MKAVYLKLLAIIVLIIASCSKKENIYNNQSQKDSTSSVVIITEDDYMKEVDITKTHGDYGKYADFFSEPDATIGISSSRYYQLGDETVFAFYDPVENVSTKGANYDDHAFDIQINGINVFSPNTKSGNGSIVNLFGNSITFNLDCFGPGTKSMNANEVQLYAPEIVRIQFPNVPSEDNRYPLCYYKDFIVRWNADSNNVNGVVILVKWNGTMVFGNDYSSSYVYHTICVPDTGSFELDECMFEEIPDAAYCHLYLIRGDVENIEINETNIRLLAESHDVLDFVLVRNVE